MTISDLEKPLPATCYAFIQAPPGKRIGLLLRDCPGALDTYFDQEWMTDSEVRSLVDTKNKNLGVPKEVAEQMYKISFPTNPLVRTAPELVACFAL